MFPIGNMEAARLMLGEEDARAFGQLVRERRKALGLRQEDVVLLNGVGRRSLIEMEASKPTARLGPALMTARQLGVVVSLAGSSSALPPDHEGAVAHLPVLPDLPSVED